MNKDIYGVKEAIVLLKDGAILKDSNMATFVYKKNQISVYSSNSSFSLKIKEFLELYKDTLFILLETDDGVIDNKKDEEYYNFKHK